MRTVFRAFVALSLLSATFFGMWFVGSCDKPFEPFEPKDYPFYISASNPSQLFTFYPVSRKLDSVAVPWNAATTVSADGKLLYVALGSSVLVVDSDSFSTVAELFFPHTNPIAVSSDNRYIAVSGLDLYILRTSDYSLVYSDTTQLLYGRGSFSSDGETYYCSSTISQDSSFVVYQVDLSDSLYLVTRTGFADGSVIQVIPSVDEVKLFLYLRLPYLWTYAFEVYDVNRDSVIFRDILVSGGGTVTVTPNGKLTFYTNPGRTATDPTADHSLRIFNTKTNQIDSQIYDTAFFCISSGCPNPKLLAVTPDGRWLGILGGDVFQVPALYLYDIQRGELVYRSVDSIPALFHQFRNISTQGMR